MYLDLGTLWYFISAKNVEYKTIASVVDIDSTRIGITISISGEFNASLRKSENLKFFISAFEKRLELWLVSFIIFQIFSLMHFVIMLIEPIKVLPFAVHCRVATLYSEACSC